MALVPGKLTKWVSKTPTDVCSASTARTGPGETEQRARNRPFERGHRRHLRPELAKPRIARPA